MKVLESGRISDALGVLLSININPTPLSATPGVRVLHYIRIDDTLGLWVWPSFVSPVISSSHQSRSTGNVYLSRRFSGKLVFVQYSVHELELQKRWYHIVSTFKPRMKNVRYVRADISERRTKQGN